ncbi:MAG: 6-pyruvoyltetrahydropterin/6-carboxytetrahydropterin synthase [Planctomycetota bacterium]|jgi:6-pyruvoyltetrahydropterin/6-carboxytetrahydropterin synthase
MEGWGIDIAKEYLKFSAAHFLIFPDGSAERLHGHNYRVYVELEGDLTECGLVLDFTAVKPVVREIVDRLDEHWLLPGEHPELTIEMTDGLCEVRYRERYYASPEQDVIVLPINNTSSENLAAYVGRELLGVLQSRFPQLLLSGLRVAVEETLGQRGVWRFRKD